ncbi:hypothetical protein [Afipia sp. Root123D2]|uniref:hypothetical protein n=1 Tax=Afipia sp. Root123D2 TaxID=1736436 RepID=UPI000AFF16D3|nr:hypothetical protein [Afipia sp. Root123D2]
MGAGIAVYAELSWPGLTRPSTTFVVECFKAGHDEILVVPHHEGPALSGGLI